MCVVLPVSCSATMFGNETVTAGGKMTFALVNTMGAAVLSVSFLLSTKGIDRVHGQPFHVHVLGFHGDQLVVD